MRQIAIDAQTDWTSVSYFTLCRLSDVTKYANPKSAAQAGALRGVLTVNGLGNFVSFSR